MHIRVIGVTRIIRDSLAFCCPRNARALESERVIDTRVQRRNHRVVSHWYSTNGIKMTKLEGADRLSARFLSRRRACEHRLIHAVAFHARAARALLHHAETLSEISLRTFRDFPAPIRRRIGSVRQLAVAGASNAALFNRTRARTIKSLYLKAGGKMIDIQGNARVSTFCTYCGVTATSAGGFRCVFVSIIKNGPNTN